jgi:hypothetical protein
MTPPSIELTLHLLAAAKSDTWDIWNKVLGIGAAIVAFATAFLAYLKSGRSAYTPTSGSPLGKVESVQAPPPETWATHTFPDDWDSREKGEEVRERYWKRKRLFWTIVAPPAGLAAFGSLFLWSDLGVDRWILFLYGGLSLIYYFAGLRRLNSLRGEPWKMHNIGQRSASITMAGAKDVVMSRCISALLASGVAIIELNANTGVIQGSRGPDLKLLYTPERVTVKTEPTAKAGVFKVEVVSGDVMPSTEGLLKPNSYNVRRIVAELASSAAPIETVQQEPARIGMDELQDEPTAMSLP